MATDLATALALGQVGQAGQSARTQRALAERLIGGATAGRPVYSPWAALAQGLTGGIGGYMAADADEQQADATRRAIADALTGQRNQQANQREEVATITQGRPLPEGVEGPVLPALTGQARRDALAGLAAFNPVAATTLNMDNADQAREDARLAREEQRNTQREVARIAAGARNQPQLPPGFRMRPDGTAERIPGLPDDGAFSGTGMDQQAANVLMRVGPRIEAGTATPQERQQYSLAWNHMTRPSLQMVPVDPNDPSRGTVLAEVPRSAPQGFRAPDFTPAPPNAPAVAAPSQPAAAPAPAPAPATAAPEDVGDLSDADFARVFGAYASGLSGAAPQRQAAPAPAAPAVPNASGVRPIPGTERAAPQQPAPTGFRYAPDGSLQAIPGGPAARTETRENRAETARDTQNQRQANIVIQDVDRILNMTDTAWWPTTGLAGVIGSRVPGTNAANVARLLDTLGAEAAFGRLQAMREASPTGGALGQITERELDLLKATMGSLMQSQSEQQFRDNLLRFRNTYLDIVHGSGNGPERRSLSFERREGRPPLSSFGG